MLISNCEPVAVIQQNNQITETKEVLSVSGKKKCSYCADELGKFKKVYSIIRHSKDHEK